MDNVLTDERYPSIYQRGGGGHAHPVTVLAPASPPVLTAVAETVAHSAAASTGHRAVASEVTGGGLPAGSRWPAKYQVALAVATLLTLAVGVFCFAAQYFLPQSVATNATDIHGIQLPSWGSTVFYTSQPIITAGLGMGCGFLLLASRQRPGSEPWLRGCLWSLASLLVVAGMWALFAQNLFPRVRLSMYGGPGLTATPWTMALAFVCEALLIPGLASAAALLILAPVWPRRRQPAEAYRFGVDDEAGNEFVLPARKPVSWQAAWVVGGMYLIAGAVFLFAPYLFPLSSGGETISSEVMSYTTSPWPQLLPMASRAFFLTGFAAIAWGLSSWVLSGANTRPATPQS